MPDYLNPAASRFFASTLTSFDRLLILGASGWFGRTAVALTKQTGHPAMFVASSAKSAQVGEFHYDCVEWSLESVQKFRPTVVIDCAFLTRDLVSTMPLYQYVATNRLITDRLLATMRLPSIERVVSFSSGAAMYPQDAMFSPLADNPYGRLKRESERALNATSSETGVSVGIARAWSVSGAFVQKPTSYAFSDFILQAIAGQIDIRAEFEVYRRYVSVEDLLATTLATATRPGLTIIDSGGELVELQTLAERIAAEVNPDAMISRPPLIVRAPNRYFSSGKTWDQATNSFAFSPSTLEAQISSTLFGLVSM